MNLREHKFSAEPLSIMTLLMEKSLTITMMGRGRLWSGAMVGLSDGLKDRAQDVDRCPTRFSN